MAVFSFGKKYVSKQIWVLVVAEVLIFSIFHIHSCIQKCVSCQNRIVLKANKVMIMVLMKVSGVANPGWSLLAVY